MPVKPSTHKPMKAKTAKHRPVSVGGDSWRDGKKTAERGYGGRWQKARATFLKRSPVCVACEAEGRITLARVVDHIIPHRGNQALFWDTSNWQPLCIRHHNAKTAKGL